MYRPCDSLPGAGVKSAGRRVSSRLDARRAWDIFAIGLFGAGVVMRWKSCL